VQADSGTLGLGNGVTLGENHIVDKWAVVPAQFRDSITVLGDRASDTVENDGDSLIRTPR